MRSLVLNAVENALKFAPEGMIVVRLEERGATAVSPGDVVLTVTDSGRGIPEELRERVFEPFYRASPGAAPGHGLGLALIGHIAGAHGGRAAFEARKRGARLVIAFPPWRARADDGLGASGS